MRPFMIRAARTVLLSLLSLAACDRGTSVPSSTATPSQPSASPPPRHPALGVGEPRKPQPFTIEQRLLDAVSRNDRATVERALEHGAKISARDDLGRSLVLLATLDAGDLGLVRWLHRKGAALDEPDAGGRTALSFAAGNGHLEIVRYLIENGAAVDRADVQQRTPLFHAAAGNHPDVAGLLLDRGANVNARDQFGDTPLIIACSKGNGDVATLLLQHGANPALKDQEGRTAQERAEPGTAACLTPNPQAP